MHGHRIVCVLAANVRLRELELSTRHAARDDKLCTLGWLSKLWSLFGYPKY